MLPATTCCITQALSHLQNSEAAAASRLTCASKHARELVARGYPLRSAHIQGSCQDADGESICAVLAGGQPVTYSARSQRQTATQAAANRCHQAITGGGAVGCLSCAPSSCGISQGSRGLWGCSHHRRQGCGHTVEAVGAPGAWCNRWRLGHAAAHIPACVQATAAAAHRGGVHAAALLAAGALLVGCARTLRQACSRHRTHISGWCS
jgi:hypothetical protein